LSIMHHSSSLNRSIALSISLAGTLINLGLAIKFSSLWPSLKSERDSEFEGSLYSLSGDSLTLLWGLLSCYFFADAATSFVGFIGVLRNLPSCVRLCRDYSISDLFFMTFSVIFGAYAASTNHSFRTGLCEELSRQPELMRDWGFNDENCEAWFERALTVGMVLTAIVIMIRIHFVIAISNYYSHILRRSSPDAPTRIEALDHVYLLPPPSSNPQDVFVYAPVPLIKLSKHEAKKVSKVWISHSESPRSHRRSQLGRICLPIGSDEGLFSEREKSK
jgi:hypothetical protein